MAAYLAVVPPKIVKNIGAVLQGQPLLVFFSCGKDSIVMTDLLFRYYSGEKKVVFLYFVDGLEIKERVLRWYEQRWGVSIARHPGEPSMSMDGDKKYKRFHIICALRRMYDIEWVAEGIRAGESLPRRGQIKMASGGIDMRNKKVYPVATWSRQDVMHYIKREKLMLPIEYNHGLRGDFSTPDAMLLLYLKNNFPDDYRKVVERFPQLEGVVWARTN